MNNARKGCQANTYDALELAVAQRPRFMILAEEDIVVSTDVLEYFAWAAREYESSALVQAVCAHSVHGTGAPCETTVLPWFSPLVWGTWPDRWETFIKPNWHGIPGNPDAWDANLRFLIQSRKKLSAFPIRSRAQHIGEETSFSGLRFYAHTQTLSRCFAPDYPPQEYCVASRAQVEV